MTTVRMLYGISGGRADGTDWPPSGGLLETDEAEAAALVGARLAEYDSRAAEPAVVSPPAPEAAPEPAVVKPPRVNAPRADWAAHAIGQGATQDEVDEMTKAQLIQRFGAAG